MSEHCFYTNVPSRIRFRVWPVEHKPRYYHVLENVTEDFTAKQLEHSCISVILNGVVVGGLDVNKVIDELY